MKFRYRCYYIVVTLVHIFSCYFVLCFCSTYINSNSSLLYGFCIGCIIDYAFIMMIIPLFKTILRTVIKQCKVVCLVWVYNKML